MRSIPEDNLAYPILIKFDTGFLGSGFVLSTKNGQLFFVTAKHVLFNDKDEILGKKIEIICQTGALKDNTVNRFLVDTSVASIIGHPTADVAIIELGINIETTTEKMIKLSSGIQQIEKGASGIMTATEGTTTKLIEEVLIGNDVLIFGYPNSLGIPHNPQFDYNKPLLRKGVIANAYAEKGTVILDCPVYYGNSGGPAVEIEQDGGILYFKIIGVVSQFIPFVEQWKNNQNGLTNTEFSNSGYSVVVSMDKVFELIGFSGKLK